MDAPRFVYDDSYHVLVPIGSDVGKQLIADGADIVVKADAYDALQQQMAALEDEIEGHNQEHNRMILDMQGTRQERDRLKEEMTHLSKTGTLTATVCMEHGCQHNTIADLLYRDNERLQVRVASLESTLEGGGDRRLLALFALQDQLEDIFPELRACSGLAHAVNTIRTRIQKAEARLAHYENWPHCEACNFSLQDQGTPNGYVCLLCNSKARVAELEQKRAFWQASLQAVQDANDKMKAHYAEVVAALRKLIREVQVNFPGMLPDASVPQAIARAEAVLASRDAAGNKLL